MPEISDRIGKGDRAKVGRGDPPDVEKPDLMGRDDGNREGHMACSELPEGQCAFEEGAMPEKATLQRVAKDGGKGRRRARRPASSCAKRSSTCARESTGLDRPDKPSRSGCRKLAAPGSRWRRRGRIARRPLPSRPQGRGAALEPVAERCRAPRGGPAKAWGGGTSHAEHRDS